VRVENGSMVVADQAGSIKFNNGTEVDVPVDQSALDLYTRYLVSHVNTTVSRPDFPTAAKLLSAFWQRDINPAPLDGVISIDPLALARVLKATGPITVMGRELTHENAVKTLLSDVYVWWDSYADPEAADTFFALVAEQIFSKVSSGSFDIKEMFGAVTTSIGNGDIMVYSEDPTFAEIIAGERVSGVLPTSNDDATTIGVYYRDTSASKIDYYMNSAIDITGSCSAGTSTFGVSSSLNLDISQAAADALPRYVKSRDWGSTHFRTEVFVYGPPGTTLQSATVDGRDARPTRTDISDLGRPVAAFETYLRPGETATVDAVFAGTGDFGPLALQSTPMIRPTVKQLSGTACG
jgi:hypothetical protein